MRIATFIIIPVMVLLSGKIWDTFGEVNGNGPQWIKIAVTTISFTEVTSELLVLESKVFDSVKFKVKGSSVILENLVFYFETGENQSIKVNILVEKDMESRPVELTGGKRRLMKVGFYYKSPSGIKSIKPVVELWGSKKL